jgi:hypothetical protein
MRHLRSWISAEPVAASPGNGNTHGAFIATSLSETPPLQSLWPWMKRRLMTPFGLLGVQEL